MLKEDQLKNIVRWLFIALVINIVWKITGKKLLQSLILRIFYFLFVSDDPHGIKWWQHYPYLERIVWKMVDMLGV
ncbi:hypothetical protein TBLA_0F00400 [Henningerozyma blattae CBS 6284]|uniref:Uncharacterized protein n=1 Tax=Henningerozyma blattae (strain ATCC 34711 / CBS 6284 / DSM 70876 / NBRC 10599 / NRRL Y-10934 / UCD 77-7) TaxID=1071380 RepID=I2H5D2_HENB6|nr:hypothetical protein TBLA_0F00400 [Tetrapisispora blattae CBS 6284]CCH61584.1 hypothetical protein TBLA_0F00400 [Tetrapisispora blattae CBS 6284]